MSKFVFQEDSINCPFPNNMNEDINLNEYYENYLNNALSEEEVKYFFNYLLANVKKDDVRKYTDLIYSYIINKNNISADEMIFVAHFTMFLCTEKMMYDEKGIIKDDYKAMEIPPLIICNFLDSDELGSYDLLGEVLLNGEKLTCNSSIEIMTFINVICHEMRHYQQDYELSNGLLTAQAFSYFLATITPNDDNRDIHARSNYWFSPIEMDAEEFGYIETLDIYKKYAPEKKTEIGILSEKAISIKENKTIAYAYSSDMKLFITDDYEFINLMAYIDYLNNDPDGKALADIFIDELISYGIIPNILLKTSDNKVSLLPEEELLKKYMAALEDQKEVFALALRYLYTNKNNHTINNFSFEKIAFIKHELEKEKSFIESIKRIERNPLLIIRGDRKTIINHILSEIRNIRLHRLKEYEKYLESLDKLTCYNVESIINECIELIQTNNTDELNNMFNDFEKDDYTITNDKYYK